MHRDRSPLRKLLVASAAGHLLERRVFMGPEFRELWAKWHHEQVEQRKR
jgi:hypothetical protein